MEIIKESDFRKDIKTAPKKGYLFFGEEDYMKSYALSLASEVISPDETLAFFNEIKLDSFTYSPSALINAIMPMPMMAERKLITITGLDFNAFKQKEIDELCTALAYLDEYDYNTLIIHTASDRFNPGFLPKKPSSLLSKLSEHLVPVRFEKNTPAKLASWVGKHFEHNGVSAEASLCSLMVERCGREMFNLASETDKVSFYVLSHGRSTVTKEDILNTAIPASEYDAFALTNAISDRRRDSALDILRDLKFRKADPILIMGDITKTVCDMAGAVALKQNGSTQKEIADKLGIHEYRLSVMLRNEPSLSLCKRMLARCRDADIEIKTSRDGYAVIEKLICSI